MKVLKSFPYIHFQWSKYSMSCFFQSLSFSHCCSRVDIGIRGHDPLVTGKECVIFHSFDHVWSVESKIF